MRQPNSSVGLLWATNCAQLLVRGLTNTNGWIECRLDNCHAVFEDCQIGHNPIAPWAAEWALRQEGGTLQLVDCTVGGGAGFFLESNAIQMVDGDLRLLGSTVLAEGTSVGTSYGIGGIGNVRYDPTVTLPPTDAFASGIVALPREMPALRSAFAGATTTATLRGPAGGIGAIVISLPAPRVEVPIFADAVWVDAGGLIWAGLGVLGPGSPVLGSLPWTPGMMPGVTAVWQGLSLDAANDWQLSNPSWIDLP